MLRYKNSKGFEFIRVLAVTSKILKNNFIENKMHCLKKIEHFYVLLMNEDIVLEFCVSCLNSTLQLCMNFQKQIQTKIACH